MLKAGSIPLLAAVAVSAAAGVAAGWAWRGRTPVVRRKSPRRPCPAGGDGGLPASARVLVVTRIHGQNASGQFDPSPLRAFLKAALVYADAVAIAVEIGDVLLPRLVVAVRDVVKEFQGGPQIHVIPVSPWGKFVPALNASLSLAVDHGFSHVLFQSLETALSQPAYQALRRAFHPQHDLVVGAALPGHDFRPSREEARELTGLSSPWNTLALWSVRKLGVTGFLGVADGLGGEDRAVAGIEEVTAIALAQHLRGQEEDEEGGGCAAKLVRLPGVEWKVQWQDPAREEWHRKKMQGKRDRADRQMQQLALPHGGWVWHLEEEEP